MYSVDGEFGRVRHIRAPLSGQTIEVSFSFKVGGWHRCNDKYCIQREGGQKDHLLLFSLTEGGRIQIDDRAEVRLPAGSVAWLPPGIKHRYGTLPGGLWEFYWSHIDVEEHLQFESIFNEDFILMLSSMEKIKKEFEKMLQSRHEEVWEFQIEGSGMLGAIYHIMLQESIRNKKKCSDRDEMVRQIILEMEDSCEKEWNLPEAARQHYISVPQLIRRFKAQTGLTPYSYLMMLRLRTAEMYLSYTNMSVKEISKQVGFPNTSNFIQQFRKEKGITPSKYRQSNL